MHRLDKGKYTVSDDFNCVFTVKDKLKEFFSQEFDSKVFDFAYNIAMTMDFEINFSTEEYHDIFITIGIANERDYNYGDMMTFEAINRFKEIIVNHYGNKHTIDVHGGEERELRLFKDQECVNGASKWFFAGLNDIGLEDVIIDEIYELQFIDLVPLLSIVK